MLLSCQRATSKMHKFKPVVSFADALKWADQGENNDVTLVYECASVCGAFCHALSLAVLDLRRRRLSSFSCRHVSKSHVRRFQNDSSMSFEGNVFRSFDNDAEE